MSFVVCFVRDFCRNICKKKSNFVSVLFILVVFVLAHLSLLSINRVNINNAELKDDNNSLSKTHVNLAYKLKENVTENQNEEREEQEDIKCNENCVEAFIDNFLFADDEADNQTERKGPKKKKGFSSGKGKGRRNKSAKKEDDEKVNDETSEESSTEKPEGESEFFLPTRARGKNQNLYKEDVATDLGSSWTREMAEKRRQVFQERADNVSRSCQNLQQKGGFFQVKNGKLQDNLRWVQSHKFVWCPIFKSASTTWVKNLLLLAGEKYLSKSLHGRVRELYSKPQDPRERNQVLKESMKIIIVRHPLDRLLSAYRDKMLRVRSAKDPYVQIQEQIAVDYVDPKGLQPTTSEGPSKDNSEEKQVFRHPTFSQFLLKVRDDMKRFWKKEGDSQVNLHWRPYWITCGPCQLKYDVIAQVETLGPDQEYIIRELDLQDILYNAHTHASNFDSYNGTSEATQHYYGQVPLDLLNDIIALYQPDFDLFGYSPQLYIDIAKNAAKSPGVKT